VTRLLMMLSMIFLSGCQAPEIRDRERCLIVLRKDNITPRCRCHQYHIGRDKVGKVGDSYNKPLEYCDRLVGFRPDEWALLYTDIVELMEWVNDKADQGQ